MNYIKLGDPSKRKIRCPWCDNTAGEFRQTQYEWLGDAFYSPRSSFLVVSFICPNCEAEFVGPGMIQVPLHATRTEIN